MIEGSGGEEDIKPEDLLKLKVTMCCKPKKGKDQEEWALNEEEWALKDITSPPKDKDNRLQPCGGNCFANDNNRYLFNSVMALMSISVVRIFLFSASWKLNASMSCCILADLIEFGKELEKQMCNRSGILGALAPSLTVAGSVAERTR